ncbi:extra-large guanine nucleotide-binding protein 1 [Tripterygium wilfordii]|uniref:Extra-large guanine nucleotide-binding protein 1 n=1 Tax=Tripterygium wilfordii TaxID=458696 RepID=A0A7J7CVR9_TRIWF|nr:extra-large guanine nucleotide-binding protein 1-like [Tripterygium wilfordii]XP_038720847.1 extra-large guanine nucleotide-binding protein 1-like [Tripterygium wilfordii]KAF5738190.1 extra-large guanine nucleotide-binding protein 1 [Tripterygium wilfordii]
MPPESKSVPAVEDGIQYSFAMEYTGPPLHYGIPRAVPINVDMIPVAAVVPQPSLSEKHSLPVVKPIMSSDPMTLKLSRELKPMESPTSVISFDHRAAGSCDASKDLALGTEITVSPTSVIAFEESEAENHRDCGLSGELSSSGPLEFTNGCCGHSNEFLSNATGSSSTIEFSDSLDKSRESSSRLKVSIDLNQVPDWESNESLLSLDYPSSRVTGDCNNESNSKPAQVVTFRDVESDDGIVDDDFVQNERQVVRVRREVQSKGKKGACYRCLKGSRFTDKEVCIVCDAKYCSNCVLRAMGSMPEGRKCVTCIGFPIDELKRRGLGKCSRMLKKLLNELEVRQIMNAEKFCEANQLPPEYVFVNGTPLCHEELVILQTCANPPKKFKPGNYWYDKVSGLWGKEGQKPSQIITPHLNVGGPIRVDSSNGNTQVFINGREITKVELRMLQLAGVQCAGNPHFWVNEDGSYQEEGQKNTKGYIWGKAGMKLICAVLSLPLPSKSSSPFGESVSSLNCRSVPDYFEQRALYKLLLVGYSGSGTSTIFKQAKILYKDVPFSEDERDNIKLTIQSNVYGYFGILLEGRERFEEESLAEMKKKQFAHETDQIGSADKNDGKTVYSIGPRLKAFSDWLLKTMVTGNLEAIFPAATREYAPLVEELWKDPAIQATYNRRNELEMLPSVSSYYLERAVDVLRTDYEPSDLDILYAEGVTSSNGLACLDFSFPQSAHDKNTDSAYQNDSLFRYQLIRVHARGLGENFKWLDMFEDVGMVIFCISLSDYDQFSVDGNGSLTNKMLLGKKLFESIVTHPTFEQMDFLLILNKFDLFEEKIERVPLSCVDWFDDFHPLVSRHRPNSSSNSINNSPSLGQLAFYYIAVKFKRLYSSLTGRKLYVSLVKGLEPKSVDAALKNAREILKWDEERTYFSHSEYSNYSTEASSYSP